jgi:hypothetical protein
MQENYGFNDAVHSGLSGDDPNSAFDADQNFNANLIITKTNFPLVYECLGATYTTQPKIQS